MKKLQLVLLVAVIAFVNSSALGAFSYVNNNPEISIVPYGGTYTYSINWSGAASTACSPARLYLRNLMFNGAGLFTYNSCYPSSGNYTYTINGVDGSHDGRYYLYCATGFGDVYTSPVYLRVSPAILAQPQDTICVSGSSTTMGIAAGPTTAQTTYQWFDAATGTSINTAGTSPSFSPTTSHNGKRIYCRIVNPYGSANSTNVLLTVGTRPIILSQPTNAYFTNYGEEATFRVAANGSQPLSFQWSKNGVELQGANLSYLIIQSVTNSDVGTYQVAVTNLFGQTNSVSVALNVGTAVLITNHPTSVTASNGQGVTFSVGASGTSPIRYRWTKNNVPISNATNSSYFIGNVTLGSAGTYAVIVTNLYSNVTSSNATLTVAAPPLITTQPSNSIVLSGMDVTILMNASGTSPLSFQWFKNETELTNIGSITGVKSNQLFFNPATTNDSGAYYVIVTNDYGSITSNIGNLLVGIPPQTLNAELSTNNSIFLWMSGTLQFGYVLQSSTNLFSPLEWTSIYTNTADSNGIWSFYETNTLAYPILFYRAIVQ